MNLFAEYLKQIKHCKSTILQFKKKKKGDFSFKNRKASDHRKTPGGGPLEKVFLDEVIRV